MSEHSETLTEAGIVEWEREVRGYNRQQVDEVVARQNGSIRDLKTSLSQCLAEIERLRGELADAREAGGRPVHEQISERVGQILKLAEDEARTVRDHGVAEVSGLRDIAKAETEKLRVDVKLETDRVRADAQDRAERMLTAAQEQSERFIASAKAEAEEMVSSAHASAEQTVSEANKHAENTVSAAMAQSKQQIDEATARATAIHDGGERRLNLLISRHTETVRRLTEIRDVVTSLVSGETARGSLEEEVSRALSSQAPADGRSSGQHEHVQGGAHRAQRPAQPADGRRVPPHQQSPAEPAAEKAAVPHGRPQGTPADQADGRHLSEPVDTTKRQERVLDEAAAGSPAGRGIEA